MPNEKKPKTKYVEYLRHAEYYDMQSTFDELYARSQAGEIFDGLMDVILSRENILLAYRNIKSNTGSFTPVWGDRIFEKCGIRRDEEGDGGKTLEIRGKRRLSARDGGANYQQS